MKTLYKYNLDCGRMGDIDGIFVADDADVLKAMGKHVNFGEALGKHSQIDTTLEAGQFKALTSDADFIEKFSAFKCASGFNPLALLAEQEADGDFNE